MMGVSCEFSEELLHAWADGEAGDKADLVSDHVAQCAICAGKVEAATRTGKILRSMISQELGPVEPLEAIKEIRSRIEGDEEGDVVLGGQQPSMFQRHAVFIVGLGLGALVVAAYWYWMV